MFRDKVSPLYDLFENVYNGRVYEETGGIAAEFIDSSDTVYINNSKKSAGFVVKTFKKPGADFKRQFDIDSYRKFFDDCGAKDVEYIVVDGRMPCAIAVITKK